VWGWGRDEDNKCGDGESMRKDGVGWGCYFISTSLFSTVVVCRRMSVPLSMLVGHKLTTYKLKRQGGPNYRFV